jgi:hypothetical protein
MKYWEIIADKLSAPGLVAGLLQRGDKKMVGDGSWMRIKATAGATSFLAFLKVMRCA